MSDSIPRSGLWRQHTKAELSLKLC